MINRLFLDDLLRPLQISVDFENYHFFKGLLLDTSFSSFKTEYIYEKQYMSVKEKTNLLRGYERIQKISVALPSALPLL